MLLHPLRLQIMELAIEETSGIEAARRLGLPRQMVSYHISALEKAGFLIPIGEVRRRNMVERRVRSGARAYLISPDILGPLSGARRRPDPASPGALLALTARIQRDLGGVLHAPSGAPPPALSFSSKLHFSNDPSRNTFAQALGESVVQLIGKFSTPAPAAESGAEPYALVLGLYPLPHSTSNVPEGDQR